MQISRLFLVALLISGCSAKKSDQNDAESFGKIGLIVAREDAVMIDVEDESRTSTGAYGSISSGGRFSIGSGVWFSPWTSGSSSRLPMRYDVELQAGERMTVYHDSYDFQIGDCVEIGLYPDEAGHPPAMRRIKDGC